MKYSLKSSDKLRLKSEFAYVRERGKKFVGRYCVLVAAQPSDGKLRCGVICGKKFSKKAVTRNRARRILWESFRLLKPKTAPCHMILITRKFIADIKQQDAQSEVKRLLKQAGLTTD